MNVAYVRVSTIDQNEARQIEALQKYNIERWFSEKVSGKNTDRPQLKEMLDFVRNGDTVYIHDFSRLSRSVKDLLEITEMFERKGVHFVSNKENLDTRTPTGKLMLTLIGAINEFERTNLLERQREGIEIAKNNDKGKEWKDRTYKGRLPFEKRKNYNPNKFEELYQRYLIREISKSEFARQIGASRPTLDRLLTQRKAEEV